MLRSRPLASATPVPRASARAALAPMLALLLVSAAGLGPAAQAQAEVKAGQGGWPPGLSAEARRSFEAYELRVLEAGREVEIAPAKMPSAFVGSVVVPIARETLAANWPAVREYADKALAALPVVAAGGLEARKATAVFPPPEGQEEFDRALALIGTREVSLAAIRFWEPAVVAKAAASQILAQALGPEDYARHSILSGFLSESLARTTWQGEEALILAQGAWVVVFAYLRTPRGLIFAKRSWLFPRPGVGPDSFK